MILLKPIYLYLVTNDIDLTTDKILEIYKRRWKIEEYHKSLKQNLKYEGIQAIIETILTDDELEKLKKEHEYKYEKEKSLEEHFADIVTKK